MSLAGKRPGIRGVRKQNWHPDSVRQKIQASQIINRLTAHINSDKPIMDSSQVTAALGLLRKCVPDLQAVLLSAGADAGVTLQIVAPTIEGAAVTISQRAADPPLLVPAPEATD